MTQPRCGEKCDVTITNVRVVGHPSARLVRIADEHGDTYDMPPQAAITRPGQYDNDRVRDILSLLDSMEAEGTIKPSVANAVRRKLGLPPKHWPPQPGDVWHDGFPFGDSLWFASHHEATGDNPDWPSRIVMTNIIAGTGTKTPQELLAYATELSLAYRHQDGSS
ncbi:hypothetical protein [Nonomuraea gerenzanensis]|uniref:Uncharacterized protein n=1 Tax=Nonomuraea gerenzanensis TaxID=93944 RepID=A0A1M4BKW7_9ACTN|nr:hypothetical protein [Nonomuraea gerenzanensis]UBU09994.1 hypothetical protein LCN96_37335 [Nonomuraea gerenzanensis]SAP16297.1 hypothetical protein BN4615_P10960 [Nonomuraea gerenzanensis]